MTDPMSIRHDLDDLPTRFAMATNFVQQGEVQKAGDAFAAISADHPNCHEAHYMRGRICMSDGQLNDAASHLARAESLDPGNPEYLLRLGQVALMQRDDTAAIAWFEKAQEETEDDSAELAGGYARALAMARRFPEADAAYERACAIDPMDASLWIARSAIQTRRGHAEGAEDSLRRATQSCPTDPRPYAELALLLEQANKLDQAQVAAEMALQLEPSHAKALIARARLARRRHDLSSARQDLEEAVALATDRDTRQLAVFSLAQVLDELGSYDEAFQCMATNTKSLSDLGASQRHLGESFLKLIAVQRRGITPALVQSWPDAPPDDRAPPVFFVGFPRSGTTLFEQMLAAHPHFVTTDEQPSLFTVQANLIKAAGSEEMLPAALGQLTDDQIRRLRAIYWRDIDGYLGPQAQGVRVVDKHPMNVPNLAIARRLFPEAQVIMSLRDPRDICVSCVMNLARSPMAASLFQNFQSTAEVYSAVIDLWFHFRETLGFRAIETRYEEVVDHPADAIRRVLSFLDAPWDDAVMQFQDLARERVIRTASYEQVTRSLHKSSIGRWRNYEKHMGPALETLAPYVAQLGYGAES